MSVAISFGRNIGNAPMPEREWRKFRRDVDNTLTETVGAPDTHHYGTGVWNGVKEESAIVTVFEPREEYVPLLVNRLSELANRYDQDAIAVTTGNVVFAEKMAQ